MYVLSMFPYPSGKLHMGHVRVYTIGDALARYHRLQGRDVIHPMGWDSFGLPAENAARQKGVDPAAWTEANIAIMKEQLEWMCYSFDWDRELSTCDPSYYKWTQWLFCQLIKKGLAYQKEALVNWDPVDRTVLAAEQVDGEGRSWRSGAKVEKKPLLQWYIKTTAYSEELFQSLDALQGWKDIPQIQKWWIGKPHGTTVDLDLVGRSSAVGAVGAVSVHVARPESLFAAAFVVVAPSHFEAARLEQTDTSSSSRLPVDAVVPLTGARLPVFVSGAFPFKIRSAAKQRTPVDAVLGAPALYDADKTFADEQGIDYKKSIFASGDAVLTNCHPLVDGLSRSSAAQETLRLLRSCGRGGHVTSPILGDWLISRQRYWGTPIPVVHCEACGAVPVPDDQLPVLLPKVDLTNVDAPEANSVSCAVAPSSASPLAHASPDWLDVACPACGRADARRETDTMDTFVDSSWYYVRFLDSRNEKVACDESKAKKELPVDVYVGGKEHASLHLFYARFMHRFLRDLGLVSSSHAEPFKKLLPQGMVMGQSFKVTSTGQYVLPKKARLADDQTNTYVHEHTGEPLETQYEKMSKSKLNGVDPQECVEMWGCDTTRICMLANVPPDFDRPWSLTSDIFMGTINWQRRLWAMVTFFLKERSALSLRTAPQADELDPKSESTMNQTRNNTLKAYEYHFECSFNLNTAIMEMHVLSNVLRKLSEADMGRSPAFERAMADLTIMISPIAPMFASELWRGLASAAWHYPALDEHYNWSKDVLEQKWPQLDADFRLPLDVEVNGEKVMQLRVPKRVWEELDEEGLEAFLRKHVRENEEDFVSMCGEARFNKVTLVRTERHLATANIIMNSIPSINLESESKSEDFSDDRQPKKKLKKKKWIPSFEVEI